MLEFSQVQINGSSYHGSVDIDAFLNFSVKNGSISRFGILDSVRIIGVYTGGSYTTQVRYAIWSDKLIINNSGIIGATSYARVSFYLNSANFTVGEFL